MNDDFQICEMEKSYIPLEDGLGSLNESSSDDEGCEVLTEFLKGKELSDSEIPEVVYGFIILVCQIDTICLFDFCRGSEIAGPSEHGQLSCDPYRSRICEFSTFQMYFFGPPARLL